MTADDLIYKQSRRLKLNKSALEPELVKLADVLRERLKIEMINAVYDLMNGTPRLNIVVGTTEQFASVHQKSRLSYNKNVQKLIAREFRRIIAGMDIKFKYETDNLFVCFTDFEHEAKTAANGAASAQLREGLLERYEDSSLWQVVCLFTTVTIFYISNADVEQNDVTGVSEEIKAYSYACIKEHDEFDYYTEDNFTVMFDSKENVDNHYDGNLYYYFK